MLTLKSLAAKFNIPVVKAYEGTAENMEMLLEETRGLKGSEGWVIRFDDGHMLKVKAEEYCRFHKTKDSMNLEKNIVELLINEKIDDVKPFMMVEDRVRVEEFEDKFWNGITDTVRGYNEMWVELCSHKMDRKRFALERVPMLKVKDHNAPGIMFGAFDGKDLRGMVVDLIRKNCNTQTKIDSVRHLWGGASWSYHFDGDV